MKLFNDYIIVFVEPLISLIDNRDVYDFDHHYTFNYTNTYETFLMDHVKTKHLHGSISRLDKSKIVMGFNRSVSIKNKNLISFTKNYQRMLYDTDHKLLGEFSNEDDLVIYIWGHSLDITDKFFIDQIIYGNSLNYKLTLKILIRDSHSNLLRNLIHIYGDETINTLYLEKKIQFIEGTKDNIRTELKNDLSEYEKYMKRKNMNLNAVSR